MTLIETGKSNESELRELAEQSANLDNVPEFDIYVSVSIFFFDYFYKRLVAVAMEINGFQDQRPIINEDFNISLLKFYVCVCMD